MSSVYTNGERRSEYTCKASDPGGENSIIMFKSCFPNSKFRGPNSTKPDDLRGQNCYTSAHTLGNAKQVYRDILEYMKTRTDKMFVAVTAPPLVKTWRYRGKHAAMARKFNDWLVKDWLKEANWENKNVFVFDFYNVLTGDDHHHRVVDGKVEHTYKSGSNFAAYPVARKDSHPDAKGNQRSTDEFVPLLNAWVKVWHSQK
jgi:hypothetical protein